ncbi:MAG: thioredoxin-dependent thiol peroxidase [Clostridia bacterium]|nr:thioredoxin-dependent thiol peroxidase [Clostridia bacterium]
MIAKGKKAIDFKLKNHEGKTVGLEEFKGKKVVLYFYPKDNTSGCTIEAEGFRDVYDEILAKGAVVLGVSPDAQKSHEDFREKFNLPFHLLSDEDHSVAEAYGAWGEKKMYGKAYMGILRSTFIIDEKGVVTHVFPKVSPKDHAKEILEALEV